MNIFSPDNASPNDAPDNYSPEDMARGRFYDVEASVYNLARAADHDMQRRGIFSRAAEAIVGVASNSPETGLRTDDAPRPELILLDEVKEDVQQPTSPDAGSLETRIAQAQAYVKESYGFQEAA